MNYIKIILTGSLLAAVSGAFAQKSFVVKGQLADNKNGLIRITYINKEETIKDSIYFEHGKFEFKGTIEAPCAATIVINPINGRVTRDQYYSQDRLELYIESGTTMIQSKTNLHSAQIRGGSQQREYRLSQDMEDTTAQQIWAMNDLGSKYMTAGNTRGLDSLKKRRIGVLKTKSDFDSLFVLSHPQSYVAFWKLYWYYRLGKLDYKQTETIFKGYSKDIHSSYFGSLLSTLINTDKTLQPGQTAPVISLPDTTGNQVTLSSLKGKYVLVCFLANPAQQGLQSLYTQLSGKNFTIYGITFSDNPNRWKKAVQINGAPWINVMDDNDHQDSFHGLVSKTAKAYNRSPQNINQCFLIGPDGTIVLPATPINPDLSKKITYAIKN